MKKMMMLFLMSCLTISACHKKCVKEEIKEEIPSPLRNTNWVHVLLPNEGYSSGNHYLHIAAVAYHFMNDRAEFLGLDKDLGIVKRYYIYDYYVEDNVIHIGASKGPISDNKFTINHKEYTRYNHEFLPMKPLDPIQR